MKAIGLDQCWEPCAIALRTGEMEDGHEDQIAVAFRRSEPKHAAAAACVLIFGRDQPPPNDKEGGGVLPWQMVHMCPGMHPVEAPLRLAMSTNWLFIATSNALASTNQSKWPSPLDTPPPRRRSKSSDKTSGVVVYDLVLRKHISAHKKALGDKQPLGIAAYGDDQAFVTVASDGPSATKSRRWAVQLKVKGSRAISRDDHGIDSSGGLVVLGNCVCVSDARGRIHEIRVRP